MIRDLGDFAHRWDCRKNFAYLGAEEIRPGFCLSNPKKSDVRWNASEVLLSVSTGKFSQISRQRGRSTKRRMFIVSDRADGYFVSSPWSGTVRFC